VDPSNNKSVRMANANGQMNATFRNSRRVLAFGGLRAAGGVILIIVFSASTMIPFAIAGVVALVAGIGTLRSKVTVDRAAMHIRGALGWRHLGWSSVLGFLVERTATRVGTMHSVVILRSKGRSLHPYALAADTREDAQFYVSLLETLRDGECAKTERNGGSG
jgi:hypothetical protein